MKRPRPDPVLAPFARRGKFLLAIVSLALVPVFGTADSSGAAPRQVAQTDTGAADAQRNEAEQRANEKPGQSDQDNSDEDTGSHPRKSDDLTGPIRDLGGAVEVGNDRTPAPQPAKKTVVTKKCENPGVLDEDDFLKLLAEGAKKGGFAPGGAPDPRDADTQIHWDQALQNESDVQDRLEREFATMQGDVAKAINDYLAAASAWQENFAHVSSATTGLQGLLQNWTESRAILEKADFAFAMANLGVGGTKLGFKAIKWISKARAAAVATAEASEAAASALKTAETASEAWKTEGGVHKALPKVAETGSEAWKTEGGVQRALPKATEAGGDAAKAGGEATKAAPHPGSPAAATPVKPNQTFAPVAAVSDEGASMRASGIYSAAEGASSEEAQFQQQVRKMQRLVKKANAAGDTKTAARIQGDIDKLVAGRAKAMAGAKALRPVAGTANAGAAAQEAQLQEHIRTLERQIEQAHAAGNAAGAAHIQSDLDRLVIARAKDMARAQISPQVQALAKEAGIDTAKIVEDANVAPDLALEGVKDNAEINTAVNGIVDDVEMTVLRRVAESRGWHDIPQVAINAIGKAIVDARKTLAGVKGAGISKADVEALKKLKAIVERNGLNFSEWLSTAATESAGAGKEIGSNGVRKVYEEVGNDIALYYTKADVALINDIIATDGDVSKLRALMGPIDELSLNALARAGAAAPKASGVCPAAGFLAQGGSNAAGALARPTEQQLTNVMNGTGRLGQVGLDNVMDEFGLTERIEGKGLFRAAAGEMWELFTSPSATVGSHYASWVALDELEGLLKNDRPQLLNLGVKLDDAARALSNLQGALKRAGVGDPNSDLEKKAPNDLQKALDDLDKAFNSGSPGWQKDHQAQMDERRKHIEQKLADLADTMKDLNALSARMGQLKQWLDSVRLNPDKSLKTPLQAFNPETFVRLGSISLYLRAMGASAFGLTQDVPFHMVPLTVSKPPPAPKPPTPLKTASEEPKSSLPPDRRTHIPDEAQPDGPGGDTQEDEDFDKFMHGIWREERKANEAQKGR